MGNKEILNKEYLRRDLVKRITKEKLNREEIDSLHCLDRELLGIDIEGVMFDELFALEAKLQVAEWRANTLEKIVSESMDSEHSYTQWIRENSSLDLEKIKAK